MADILEKIKRFDHRDLLINVKWFVSRQTFKSEHTNIKVKKLKQLLSTSASGRPPGLLDCCLYEQDSINIRDLLSGFGMKHLC